MVFERNRRWEVFFVWEWVAVLLALVGLSLLAYYFYSQNRDLRAALSDLHFSKRSQSVRYGKLSEQWIPLSAQFPYDPQSFKFLGDPIDGVAFLEDKIVFCEFKAAGAQLSGRQKEIKRLVGDKRVEWLELRTK